MNTVSWAIRCKTDDHKWLTTSETWISRRFPEDIHLDKVVYSKIDLTRECLTYILAQKWAELSRVLPASLQKAAGIFSGPL